MGYNCEMGRSVQEHVGRVHRCLGAPEEQNGSVSSRGVPGVHRGNMQGVRRLGV